jgi:antitoxin VapB
MRIHKAKLFQNGQSQAVRLPREFRMKGEEVFVRRLGNAVVLIPLGSAWSTLEESLNMFDGFMVNREQPNTLDDREGMFD